MSTDTTPALPELADEQSHRLWVAIDAFIAAKTTQAIEAASNAVEVAVLATAAEAVRAALSAAAVPAWRCFHCDAAFTDKDDAAAHFGTSEMQQPMCQIDPAHFRWMEAQHRRNVDDDSEALRTIRALASEHERLRRQAEEDGYARGIADAKKYPAELGLAVAPAPSAPQPQESQP